VAVADERRFPYSKYRRLRDALIGDGTLAAEQLAVSPKADPDVIARTHDPAYVSSILDGTVAPEVLKAIGFRWSADLPERSRASVGGAIAAARTALEIGLSGQLGGGTHHAYRDRGAGFCVFNDQAIVAQSFLHSGLVRRMAVLDLDVHQGDGTAALLANVRGAFVANVHGANNFPFQKAKSDLDLPLPDGADDAVYLNACQLAIDAVVAFAPDLILYQAGVDALAEDRLGRLNVTHAGLRERDRLVFDASVRHAIPISMAIGGGYADPIDLTVEAYVGTYEVAKAIYAF